MPVILPEQSVLLDMQSSAVDVEVIVQVIPEPLSGESLLSLRTVNELPEQFTVTIDGWQVRVAVDQPSDLFPAEFIRYRHNGELGEVYRFADVPAGALIYGFKPSAITEVSYDLSVFARGTKQPALEARRDYEIIVRHNYNTGKAALLAALSEA